MYLDLIISDKIKAIIEKTCHFLIENGSEHEEYLLKTKSSNDENFGFLFPENPYHIYYKSYLEWLKTSDSQNKKFDFLENIKKSQQKNPIMKEDIFSVNQIPPQNATNINTTGASEQNQNNKNNSSQANYNQTQATNNFNTGVSATKKKNRWSESVYPVNVPQNETSNNRTNYDIYGGGGQAFQSPQIQQTPLLTNLQMNITYPSYNYTQQPINNSQNFQVEISLLQ